MTQFRRSAAVPQVGQISNIDYPSIAERRLSNGLTVAAIQEERLPRVSIRLGIPGGRISNPPDALGALQVATDLIFEGTKTRTSFELAEAFDRYAIHTDTDVFLESCRFFVSVLSPHLEEAFELFSDVILRSSYDAAEFEKIKVRWSSYLLSERSQVGFLALEKTMSALFPGHPYSRLSVPIDQLQSLSRETAISVFESRRIPDHSCLLFAGDVDLDTAFDLAQRHLGDWNAGEEAGFTLPPTPQAQTGHVLLVDRPNSVQSRFEVAGRGPARNSADFLAFKLANQVFGGGASSRLFLNLRETRGYTYGAYSLLRGYQDSGFYAAAADVRSDVIADSIEQTLIELRRMCDAEPTPAELELARSEIIGDLLRRMETATSVSGLEMDRRINHLPSDYYQRYIPDLLRMTPQDVLESARRHFDPENVTITVVGDAEALMDSLANFGPVTVFDLQGQVRS